MTKGKQRSAVELIESFKTYFRNRLSPADRAYCDRIISQGLNVKQRSELPQSYIEKESQMRGLDYAASRELSNNMEYYIAVLCGLLLSYSPQKNAPVHIPEKYYRSAPESLEMALIAIPHHNIIIMTKKYSKVILLLLVLLYIPFCRLLEYL